ncbi:hypothetical protein LOK49_LG05G01324 [Camellia lanceoleosa]|uniref:Uncharacterized protein n=1 Tax=Camellia lanceoleosa TaxID=1840588 RepID=A0ACC0HKP1_9ERIC|nr:hypothetical protein LOK49_LG05G01324 [Camellia lanceoleosa]
MKYTEKKKKRVGADFYCFSYIRSHTTTWMLTKTKLHQYKVHHP